MNILAIGAHPDDIEIGCGGTLLEARKSNHEVYLLTLTRGEASGDPFDRALEILESANYLGARLLWIDSFEDAGLSCTSQLINHIEYFIHRASPDLILTHSGSDSHHDHRAVAECTLEAARSFQNILSYEEPSSRKFSPQLHLDVSDVISNKIELVAKFLSQRGKPFTEPSAIRALARLRASQNRSHMEYAEAFEVAKLELNSHDFGLSPTMPSNMSMPKAVEDAMKPCLSQIIEYSPANAIMRPLAAEGDEAFDLAIGTINENSPGGSFIGDLAKRFDRSKIKLASHDVQ